MQTKYLLKGATGIAVAAALLSASTVLAAATSTANFSRGERVMVVATVNVRSGADGPILTQETRGSTGTLVGGPINANGYTWWQINYDNGKSGWTAEDFLQSPNVSLQSSNTSNVAVTTNTKPVVTGNANSAAAAVALQSLYAQLQALEAQIQSLTSSH